MPARRLPKRSTPSSITSAIRKKSGSLRSTGTEIHPIFPFGDSTTADKSKIHDLAAFKPEDSSTNLNGAIVKGLGKLDEELRKAPQPLKFGTLVIFTSGPDRANRVTPDAMLDQVRTSAFEIFVIGADAQAPELHLIGKSGVAILGARDAEGTGETGVAKAFRDVGAKIEARARSYYLLSYCSPSRAGRHQLKIEASFANPKGKGQDTGSLRSDFDATGFGPGCDPKAPPSFDIAGNAPAPASHETKEATKAKADDKKPERRVEKKAPSAPPRAPPPPSPAKEAAPTGTPAATTAGFQSVVTL